MRNVKNYLVLSVSLIIYVTAVSLLLQQYHTIQKAYQLLNMRLSHPSVEVLCSEEPEEE